MNELFYVPADQSFVFVAAEDLMPGPVDEREFSGLLTDVEDVGHRIHEIPVPVDRGNKFLHQLIMSLDVDFYILRGTGSTHTETPTDSRNCWVSHTSAYNGKMFSQ
jgi:hypothetical protein